MLEQSHSAVEDTSFSASPRCLAPLNRQFWKAGNYEDVIASKPRVQNCKNYLHVHPKFLHSNATSHTWAFGAIAELIDNAIDEIQNGATFVTVDKISNPRDGSPALLIQDDGGGMDPEAIRRCMSFGFSDKKHKSSIGQYGNGFKTSTMRLGADVVVFSRHMDNRTSTQSVGLLSYSYLSRTGLDRIVVPMVDYEYTMSTATPEPLYHHGKENVLSNISIILQWSPYSTESELMKQFDGIGSHGTKVIVYNLWFTDNGTLELNFTSDHEDIRLEDSDNSKKGNSHNSINTLHAGNQYRYSLRVYLSILYLRIPQNFSIILRGKIVEHNNIALDLKYPEFIMYRPHSGGTKEGEVITTIGFLKEAPNVYISGFNVYHRNRLILPYWRVLSYDNSKGRGVVGVLEANFLEPTHNKQDFERSSLFQKLQTRLREMTWEYWDYHCELIGYQAVKKNRVPKPFGVNKSSNLGPTHARPEVQNSQSGIQLRDSKRRQDDLLSAFGRGRRQANIGSHVTKDVHSVEFQLANYATKPPYQQEAVALMQENKKLWAKCLEYEKAEEELNHQVLQLRREIEEAQHEYLRMFDELQSLEVAKADKYVTYSVTG